MTPSMTPAMKSDFSFLNRIGVWVSTYTESQVRYMSGRFNSYLTNALLGIFLFLIISFLECCRREMNVHNPSELLYLERLVDMRVNPELDFYLEFSNWIDECVLNVRLKPEETPENEIYINTVVEYVERMFKRLREMKQEFHINNIVHYLCDIHSRFIKHENKLFPIPVTVHRMVEELYHVGYRFAPGEVCKYYVQWYEDGD